MGCHCASICYVDTLHSMCCLLPAVDQLLKVIFLFFCNITIGNRQAQAHEPVLNIYTKSHFVSSLKQHTGCFLCSSTQHSDKYSPMMNVHLHDSQNKCCFCFHFGSGIKTVDDRRQYSDGNQNV